MDNIESLVKLAHKTDSIPATFDIDQDPLNLSIPIHVKRPQHNKARKWTGIVNPMPIVKRRQTTTMNNINLVRKKHNKISMLIPKITIIYQPPSPKKGRSPNRVTFKSKEIQQNIKDLFSPLNSKEETKKALLEPNFNINTYLELLDENIKLLEKLNQWYPDWTLDTMLYVYRIKSKSSKQKRLFQIVPGLEYIEPIGPRNNIFKQTLIETIKEKGEITYVKLETYEEIYHTKSIDNYELPFQTNVNQ